MTAIQGGGGAPTVEAPDRPAPEPRLPYPGIRSAILLVLLLLVVQNIVGALVFVARFISGVPLEALMDMDAAALGTIANSVAFGLVIWVALRKSGERPAEMFPFKFVPPIHWIPMILALGGGLLVVNEISNLLVTLLPVPDMFVELFGNILRGWFAPVFLVLVAPVTEELLFRGVFLRGFTERYGKGRAVFWSALFFGAIHVLPWQVVPAFCLGLIFAWWTIGTGSLWPALLGHGVTNGIAYIQSRSLNPTEVFTTTPQPLVWTLAGFVGLAAGLYASSRLFRRDAGRHLQERSVS